MSKQIEETTNELITDDELERRMAANKKMSKRRKQMAFAYSDIERKSER